MGPACAIGPINLGGDLHKTIDVGERVMLAFGKSRRGPMDHSSPSFKPDPGGRKDVVRGLKIVGLAVLVGFVVFRAYSAWSERRMRELDRTLVEVSRQGATEMFDAACRDPASASCRQLLVHDVVNGAPCPIVKRGLDEARAAMSNAPRNARDLAAWNEAEELIKQRCP